MKLIDWELLNLQVAFTATDGVDALRKLETLPVDILITDVRMPHMNGIELALNTRTKLPLCKILFLSGYTDKEYLKSAISLKVEQYIEKPIDIEVLQHELEGIVRQLANQEKVSQPCESFSSLVNASRLIRQEIAQELINPSRGGYSFIISRYYPLYFDWKELDSYQVVCIHSHSRQPIIEKIYQCIEISQQSSKEIDFLATQIGECDTAFIFRQPESISLDYLTSRFFEAEAALSFGVSKPIKTIQQLPEAWQEAQELCDRWFYTGKGSLHDTNSAFKEHELPSGFFSSLSMTYKSMENMFLTLEEKPCSKVQELKYSLYSMYLKMMEITINEQCMPFTRFTEFTLSEVKDLIMYGMHVFGTLGNDSYDPKVKETIHYILWNYADFNLSIKTLADHVELSQNYLCALFKQYTGTTINNIMIEVRLEKTKKLLRTTDLRMYEIASKVGMSDPNYLSSVFKQRLGMTPSQYRDRQGKGFND